jgi:archaellum component FlaC
MNAESIALAAIPHPIEIEFFSKRSNKTTKLINSADGFEIEGVHRWYDFEFSEAVYLTELRIDASGYDTRNKFEFEISHIDGTKHNELIPVENNVVTLQLGKLASGFKFRPEQRWFSQTEILRVVATGFSLSEFHEYEYALKTVRDNAEKISKREAIFANLEEREASLKESLTAITSEVGKLSAQRAEIINSSANLTVQIKDRAAKIEDIEANIESLLETRRHIRDDIETDTVDLNTLKKKIRLFPSEIAGFVEEGSRNIKNYLLLSIPFVLILGVVLWSLFSSSIDLTQLWRLETEVDIWTIFLTRVPFVLVAIALVETCGFIVGRLIFEIVKINRQRLEFSKLSIIAKDVVTSTSNDKTMTELELFTEETKLKMTLLQEHMKLQIHEEFTYTGGPISSVAISAAKRLTGGKTQI